MNSRLLDILRATDPTSRDRPLEEACAGMDAAELLAERDALDEFRRSCGNLYQRVRALFFLYAIHRFHLPPALTGRPPGKIPFAGHAHLLERRFTEAIDLFLAEEARQGPNDALSSALARGYQQLGLQNLAGQVRRSVRAVRGNQWMFRAGHPADQPLRWRKELLGRPAPLLRERTPVRMDLSHSGWSDIFFLGMDYPEGARVLNISIDLGVHGRDQGTSPPIEVCLRVIEEPVIRLVSVDLGATAELSELGAVFDFARDYLGLLKAGLIASGIVPIGMEGSGQSLAVLLERMIGPGRGLELVTSVKAIPKGSRLAVSTNLLAAIAALGMRATGQTASMEGPLRENERRLVASRAILGEWLGGSGGGWQDSGGIWPGLKVISGCEARLGDPEHGISRGRLLPNHRLLGPDLIPAETRVRLRESLLLVHGGMAQNVGPILEMVTEKYLLRSPAEWAARLESGHLFDAILEALCAGHIQRLGELTSRHFFGPLRTIVPWADNAFTEAVIAEVREAFGADFWGFWMLGGMSGGGMGFILAPHRLEEGRGRVLEILTRHKRRMERSLPFAMEPVVYRFEINEQGSEATCHDGSTALLPPGYYPLILPRLLRIDPRQWPAGSQAETARFLSAAHRGPYAEAAARLMGNLFPTAVEDKERGDLDRLLVEYGFDQAQHEKVRAGLHSGRLGLAQNRLPLATRVEDVQPGDVRRAEEATDDDRAAGETALRAGAVAVLTLAAGAGSRWTQGAGVVKALHPFAWMAGRHRSFLEAHLAKSRRTARLYGTAPYHLVSTGHLTHGAIAGALADHDYFGYREWLRLSFGRSIGLRMVPMLRDLRFAWEETPQQMLDERAQKVRASLHNALLAWAGAQGGQDYRDNLPEQCLHPVGHWYEAPNLLLNGVLRELLTARPALRTILLHNVDTLGATLDPGLIGLHYRQGSILTFEVISRRWEDRGGGLARVDGRPRLLEGLALPREEDEFQLSYYNTLTTWIEIDPLLGLFGLSRADLGDEVKVQNAVRAMAARLPAYVTLKDVKKRWGHGQEDVYPVAQYEKLWGDMSALPEQPASFVVVPRDRGQQLKEVAQLDGWLRDGSASYVESLGDWVGG